MLPFTVKADGSICMSGWHTTRTCAHNDGLVSALYVLAAEWVAEDCP